MSCTALLFSDLLACVRTSPFLAAAFARAPHSNLWLLRQEMCKLLSGKSLDEIHAVAVQWERGLQLAVEHQASTTATGASRGGLACSAAAASSPAMQAIQAFRKGLTSVLSAILLESPTVARQWSVEQRMWNLFKADMNDAKQQLVKLRPPPSALSSQSGGDPSGSAAGTPVSTTVCGAAAPAGATVAAPRTILNSTFVAQRQRLTTLVTQAERFFVGVSARLWQRYGVVAAAAADPHKAFLCGFEGAVADDAIGIRADNKQELSSG